MPPAPTAKARSGDLAALADLAARKQACLDALGRASATKAELAALRPKQQRNECLLVAALAGMSAVGALVQGNGQSVSVYQRDGPALPLGGPHRRLTQRF